MRRAAARCFRAGWIVATVDEAPPCDLPFGGFVTFVVQDHSRFGFGDFYEVEYPDDPNYEPPSGELPLGPPPTQDVWTIIGEPSKEPGGPSAGKATATALGVSPLIYGDSGTETLTFELDPKLSEWSVESVETDGPHSGGDWSVEIPAHDAFPEGLFPDVLPGPAGDAAQWETVHDADGVPTQLVWNPLDPAHNATVSIFMAGLEGQFVFRCFATLVDDGEAEVPASCLQAGPDDPEGLTLLIIIAGHNVRADVAYADHRIRLGLDVNTQITLMYPYEPSGSGAPIPPWSATLPDDLAAKVAAAQLHVRP